MGKRGAMGFKLSRSWSKEKEPGEEKASRGGGLGGGGGEGGGGGGGGGGQGEDHGPEQIVDKRNRLVMETKRMHLGNGVDGL